jgi:hypothetical protein
LRPVAANRGEHKKRGEQGVHKRLQ